jgi:hypothetical protein
MSFPKLPPLRTAEPEIVDVPAEEVTFLDDDAAAPAEPMACQLGCVVTEAPVPPVAPEGEAEMLPAPEAGEHDAAARLAQYKKIKAARLAKEKKADSAEEKEEKEEKEEEKEEAKEEAEKVAAVASETTPAPAAVEPKTETAPVETTMTKQADAPAETAPVAETVPEITWAPLLSETDMVAKEKNAAIDMTLRAADTDNPFYVMFIDGHPFGELHLADVNTTEDLRDVFVDAAFTRGVRETVAACGPADAFKTLKVRYYAAETKEVEAVQRAKVEIAQHADEAFRRRAAALKGDLLTTLHLAMEASRKNFILENPLKDSLVENMRKAGLQERIAIDVIEDAFVKSGAQYLKAMVEKAEEWLGYEPEALKQIENTVTKMAYVHPLDIASVPQDDEIPALPSFARVASPSTTPDLDADTEATLRVGRARRNIR